MASEEISELYNELCKKYQRELNRLQDSDRNTRKRGIIKLYDDVPWDTFISPSSSTANTLAMIQFVEEQLIMNQLMTNIIINDSLEKCRETALKIFEKSINIINMNINTYSPKVSAVKADVILSIVQKLCQRITSITASANISEITSFPETSEELRHYIIRILLQLVKGKEDSTLESYSQDSPFPAAMATAMITALSKALLDPFPEVKRDGADLLSLLAILSPMTIRLHFKSLLKGLCANAVHQHSKTRSITLKAFGFALACVGEDYEALMKEPILPLLSRFLIDRIASTRRELADLCAHCLSSRIRSKPLCLLIEDLRLLAILIMLTTDETEAVAGHAKENLSRLMTIWLEEKNQPVSVIEAMDVEDGESTLRQISSSSPSAADPTNNHTLLTFYQSKLTDIFLEGMENWTIDQRRLYLQGLDTFIHLVRDIESAIIPQMLACLSTPVRDEEAIIRVAAEKVCLVVGIYTPYQDLLDLLLPKIRGEIAGADTSSHRTSAIRLLTYILQGFQHQVTISIDHQTHIVDTITSALAKPSLYEYREPALREAVLLAIRSIINSYPIICKRSSTINLQLAQALVYLQTRVPSDDDTPVIIDAAKRELFRLAALSDLMIESNTSTSIIDDIQLKISAADHTYSTIKLFHQHFDMILSSIAKPPHIPSWSSSDVSRAAFDVIIREAPQSAWKAHHRVISIIIRNIQPKSGPESGSTEANMASYAAIRGDEVIPSIAEVDVRLSLLALLEGILRAGSSDWECSSYMAEAADMIIKQGLLPNLVWKAGRVEATIRKVCLAACYAMLKAGSIKVETLYGTATELVPLLVSHLDDSDVSPRHLAALCLSIVFERLRGAFGEQAVYDMYPKLLKRLDDSHDEVRLAICTTLIMFLRSAPKQCYSSTTIEYMLDQYFIHLDDTDDNIQEAVYKVIIEILNINPEAVIKKAHASMVSNRSSAMIERVIAATKASQLSG